MEIDIAAALLSGILLFFQLTTSRGDRHPEAGSGSVPNIFQLTTSRGDRHVLSAIASSEHFFQLTTSRGDRQGIIGMNVKPLNFSTHDLSWRSTVSCEFNPNSFRFSTHDLSWRSTGITTLHTDDLSFQLTTSRGGRLLRCAFDIILSIFQLTTSRGGRRSLSID